jgi:hypothetical protein
MVRPVVGMRDRMQWQRNWCYMVVDIGGAGSEGFLFCISFSGKQRCWSIKGAYGGCANGIPRNSFTDPDETPVTVALSSVTVGDVDERSP